MEEVIGNAVLENTSVFTIKNHCHISVGRGFCKTSQGRKSGKAIYLFGTHKHHKLCWLTTMNVFLKEGQLKISTLTSKRVHQSVLSSAQ